MFTHGRAICLPIFDVPGSRLMLIVPALELPVINRDAHLPGEPQAPMMPRREGWIGEVLSFRPDKYSLPISQLSLTAHTLSFCCEIQSTEKLCTLRCLKKKKKNEAEVNREHCSESCFCLEEISAFCYFSFYSFVRAYRCYKLLSEDGLL